MITVEKCFDFLAVMAKNVSQTAIKACPDCTWWLPVTDKCAFYEDPAKRVVQKTTKHFKLNKTSEVLKKHGILPHLKGYYFLLTALEELGRLPADPFFHKDLYRRVAKKLNTDIGAVEKSIHGAIKSAWHKGGLQQHWPKPPTPRVLIVTLATMVHKDSNEG